MPGGVGGPGRSPLEQVGAPGESSLAGSDSANRFSGVGVFPGAPHLFGGAPNGSSAAALLAAADALGSGGEAAAAYLAAPPGEADAALGAQLLWNQWLAAGGGAPSGAAFHRGPVQMALLHNPRLFLPVAVRATGSTWGAMLRSASMPELAALVLSDAPERMAATAE